MLLLLIICAVHELFLCMCLCVCVYASLWLLLFLLLSVSSHPGLCRDEAKIFPYGVCISRASKDMYDWAFALNVPVHQSSHIITPLRVYLTCHTRITYTCDTYISHYVCHTCDTYISHMYISHISHIWHVYLTRFNLTCGTYISH